MTSSSTLQQQPATVLNVVERDHLRALFLRLGEDYQPDKWDRDDCAICREFQFLYTELGRSA